MLYERKSHSTKDNRSTDRALTRNIWWHMRKQAEGSESAVMVKKENTPHGNGTLTTSLTFTQ